MNYITIMDFMVQDLGLKANELILYALIYGFSQDGSSKFHGSLTYIQNRTGLSRQTVINTLDKLVEKKLIVKTVLKSKQKCTYVASQEIILGLVKKLDQASQNFRPETSQKIRLNNKYINKKENICADSVQSAPECTIQKMDKSAMFESFWNTYPKKVNKKKSKEKFMKICKTEKVFNEIMAGLHSQLKSDEWKKNNGQFIPHPTTWLNGERWQDEIMFNASIIDEVQNYSEEIEGDIFND